jgi:hypothetical protein
MREGFISSYSTDELDHLRHSQGTVTIENENMTVGGSNRSPNVFQRFNTRRKQLDPSRKPFAVFSTITMVIL